MPDSVSDLRLNKGEWAEFYVMLKLLGEGKLYSANEYLQKNYSSYLNVLKVIREEPGINVLEYIVNDDAQTITIKSQETGKELATLAAAEFRINAADLFNGIKDLPGMTVPAPQSVCEFARVIYVKNPKAPSVKALKRQFGGKNDIFIEVRDSQTAIQSVLGFSIKSQFGDNPTLYNAGSSSQLLYKLSGCDDEKMEAFNSISGEDGKRAWKECKAFIDENGITMSYSGAQYSTFEENLFLVRESMGRILGWCFWDRLISSQGQYGVSETIDRLARVNPARVPNPEIYYQKAMKDFLMASFTGLTAGRPWDGREQVNGGYIVVMDDGDVLCYHSNDRESFRDYLYRNTYFEYVSVDKYCWSRIVKKDNEYYLPLNASIRFFKHTR